MIKVVSGNLFKGNSEALVNAVNIVGVMGKGIALEFRKTYPEMYKSYRKSCAANELVMGKVSLFDLGYVVSGPRWIINFPTKKHWRSGSEVQDVQDALDDLVVVVRRMGIRSISIPALGCGYGGLRWSVVCPLIEAAFKGVDCVDVFIYAPRGVYS